MKGIKRQFISAYPDEFLLPTFIIRGHPDCHIHSDTRDSMDPHTSRLLGRRCSLQDHQVLAGNKYHISFLLNLI